MGKYLNPGNEAFRISAEDDIYVDKSGLISKSPQLCNRKIAKIGIRFVKSICYI